MPEPDGKRLVVLLGGQRVGEVTEDGAGKLRLTYDDNRRRSTDPLPLSLSMPLTTGVHEDPAVRAYL